MSQTISQTDLIPFENHNRYSSIGKLLVKPSAPAYSFGSASREQAQLVFRDKKLLEKLKESPGHRYHPDQNAVLPKEPSTKIGTAIRKQLNEIVYDYYLREDSDFEPAKADNFRKLEASRVKFGLDRRFKTSFHNSNPGPQYTLGTTVGKEGPKFSIGQKRQHSASVSGSRPNVGPGAYKINVDRMSQYRQQPKVGFTKAQKLQPPSSWDKSQTYYMGMSIGIQVSSSKPSRPSYSFGKSSRDREANILKKDLARQSASIRIDHPKF